MVFFLARLPRFALATALAAFGAGAGVADEATPVPEVRPGVLKGYLPKEAIPDSAILLPPPPAVVPPPRPSIRTSPAPILRFATPIDGGLPPWTRTSSFPRPQARFPVPSAPVTEKDTPRLYRMLRRVMTDAGFATFAGKDKYQHARPFMFDGQPICTPDKEQDLMAQGSYPSGHTSIGWAWALVLAEASPGESTAVLARGRAFGESRIVCNVHWQSDVSEGRFIGAATSPGCTPSPSSSRSSRRQDRARCGARQSSAPTARLQVRDGGAGRDAPAVALTRS